MGPLHFAELEVSAELLVPMDAKKASQQRFGSGGKRVLAGICASTRSCNVPAFAIPSKMPTTLFLVSLKASDHWTTHESSPRRPVAS
mmetsp:Transcript_714/g.2898  ORF Transcript_714/g.2898 Transcript_714/m.2898 type:complete len:87 (+) Transcript_714:1427-1687(+)